MYCNYVICAANRIAYCNSYQATNARREKKEPIAREGQTKGGGGWFDHFGDLPLPTSARAIPFPNVDLLPFCCATVAARYVRAI